MRLRLATTRIVAFGLLCAVVIVTMPGCGGGNTPATEEQFRDTNLLDVGELLRMYQIEKGEPPQSFADVQAVPSLEMAAPMGFERVRTGEFVVRWGAPLPDTGEEIGTTDDAEILAYVKEAPEQGGSVLLLNRTLTTMTAEEFAAAPKAGKTPEE